METVNPDLSVLQGFVDYAWLCTTVLSSSSEIKEVDPLPARNAVSNPTSWPHS